jgi:hypothetical protein
VDAIEDRRIPDPAPEPGPPVGPELDPEALCGDPTDPASWASDPATWPAWADNWYWAPTGPDDPGEPAPARPARPPVPAEALRARGVRPLAELIRDPDYLAFKESLGEPLAPAERELLEAARAGRGPRAIGG